MSRLLIYNANLLSFHEGFSASANGSRPSASATDALLVNGPHIEALGTWEELQSLAGPDTQRIDLQGRTLMPGFHDTHIHLWKVGNLLTFMLDVRSAASLDEMLSMLEQYQARYPEAAWITARGFNEAAWASGRMPTNRDLDKVTQDRPVYLIRTCAHIAVCNSKALEICGITKDTPAPPGGAIYTDEGGRPNGIFSETALGLITPFIPPYSKTQLKTMVRAARTECYKFGITAATDPAVDPLLLETYHEMETDEDLGFRLQAIPILLPDGGGRPYPLPAAFTSDYLTVNTVKFFSDGGLSGGTAALKRTYRNSTEKGILRLQKDQYLSLCRAAQTRGLGIATHAIGDAAIEMVIEIYKQLHDTFPDAIRRIEHLGLPEARHLQDMAAYGIGTSMQAIFIHELGKNFRRHLDEEYLSRCYPLRSALREGILVALSSDAPVVKDFNPFKGIQAAITRTDSEGQPIAPLETIDVREALKAYTLSAATLSRTPQWGALQPGKLADFIVLDRDPLATPTGELTDIRVDATYVAGKPVWTR